jgi:hypothetical protein
MPRQGIAYDWKFLASVLANSDSAEQTEFFQSFVKEMDNWVLTSKSRLSYYGLMRN